ncbi:DUF2794 domain-containing protein [Stella sp.]|uniref:DUF2794 domain-containing protein n=1 Tax=Stella sp. TaxID=2912054 RepID=UPI0035B1300D
MARPASTVFRLSDYRGRQRPVYFNRSELNRLLGLYSRHVSSGEWRDYAIDHTPGRAVFSVYRHTHERPLYAIVKGPPGSDGQSQWIVMSGRQRLAQAGSIDDALGVFATRLRLVQ